jgi:signal transduction histidine kinase
VGEGPEGGIGFLEGIPLPTLVLDAGGTVIGSNSRFSALIGYLPGELFGREGFDLVDTPDRDRVRSLVLNLAEGDRVTLIISLLGKNGSRVRTQGFWSPSVAVPGLPLRYTGLFIEMPAGDAPPFLSGDSAPGIPRADNPRTGEVHRAGEPVPGRMDPARRNQIIHTIVFHDAKNCLAALHGYAQLLRDGLSGSSFLAYIDKLEEIASDIERDLGVASIFSHLGLIAPRWQNLREVVGRSASRDARGGIFMEDLPESLWCLADPLFPRVFSNLFENARRHGERVTEIRIAARVEDTGLLISVVDDGIGIPAEQKERIFELGFGRHTGYGLYLTREILSHAGFSIRETGDEGKGARFEIRIPAGRFQVRPSSPEEPDPIRIPAA